MSRLPLPLCFAFLALPAWAGVRVETRADGLKVITNEGAEYRARRTAVQLVEVPAEDLGQLIERHSEAQGLEPRLVKALIQVESGYNPEALSNKGAMGLMQLMPETARELAVSDPYDPEENVRGGTTYLRAMLDRFDDRLELALAAYNAGPGAVEKYAGIPPYRDTQAYIERVLGLYTGREVKIPTTRRSPARQGRKPYVVRRDGRILITTEPPRPH